MIVAGRWCNNTTLIKPTQLLQWCNTIQWTHVWQLGFGKFWSRVLQNWSSSKWSNVVVILVCFQVFGMAIAVVGDDAQPVLNFFTSITVVMMKITEWIITIAPVGVLFLVYLKPLHFWTHYFADRTQKHPRSMKTLMCSYFTGLDCRSNPWSPRSG